MLFQHENVQNLWIDLQRLPEKQKEAARVILAFLDSEQGDASSIFEKWRSNVLRHVNVRDHSIDVVREAMLLPLEGHLRNSLIIAALGHDIAKCPKGRLSQKTYYKAKHAYRSAEMLKKMLQNILPERDLDVVTNAVHNHHSGEEDYPTDKIYSDAILRIIKTLKDTDEAARTKETDELTKILRATGKWEGNEFSTPKSHRVAEEQQPKSGKTKPQGHIPDPSTINFPWFDAKQFLLKVKPLINIREMYKPYGPQLISMQETETVFITPEAIFFVLEKWIQEKFPQYSGLLGNYRMNKNRSRDLVSFVGLHLDKIGALRKKLLMDNTFFTAKFQVYSIRKAPRAIYYMPLRSRLFVKNVTVLEAKKEKNYSFKLVKKIEKDFKPWG